MENNPKPEKIRIHLTMNKETFLKLYNEARKFGVSVQTIINLKLNKNEETHRN